MRDDHTNNHGVYRASSKFDFLELLRKQDISIPDRVGSGNRRIAVEKRVTFRFLATLAQADHLSYPLELVHNDRPDFRLCHDANNVGIECVEAVSQEWAETDALMEHDGKHIALFEDNFRVGIPKRTASERRNMIKNLQHDLGWGDDGMERDWAIGINKCIIDKTKAFNNPDFQKYPENWLLIWDNLPGIVTNINTAMKHLMPELNCYWSTKNCYDKLIIVRSRDVIEVKNDMWKSSSINNLWNQS